MLRPFRSSHRLLLRRPQLRYSSTNEKKEYNPGFFSRHPGLALAGIVGAISLYFYRMTVNKKNFRKIENSILDEAVISSFEAYELRSSNQFHSDAFKKVYSEIDRRFPQGKASYAEFDAYLTPILVPMFPQGINHGNILERVLLALPKDSNLRCETDALLTALSLLIHGKVEDRLHALFQMARRRGTSEVPENYISKKQMCNLLTHLLETYQIPAEKRALEIPDKKYPFQEFEPATGSLLLNLALDDQEIRENKRNKQDDTVKEPLGIHDRDFLSLEEFSEMMKSKRICIWGECFQRIRRK